MATPLKDYLNVLFRIFLTPSSSLTLAGCYLQNRILYKTNETGSSKLKISTHEMYSELIHDVKMVLGSEGKYRPDHTGMMAISAAMIMRYIPDLVFAGYYRVIHDQLHIGPYQGTVIPCTPISFGKGVCGECALSRMPVIVEDVSQYPNYIACDQETRSEIVIPVISKNEFIAVLDIDGKNHGQFSTSDARYLVDVLDVIF